MNVYTGIKQTFQRSCYVSPLFVESEQIGAHVQVGRMHRDVLRRQSLLDNAMQLIFRDRRQGSVVAVKKRKPNVLIAHEEGWTSIGGIALAKTEETFIGTLARYNLLKTEPEVFVLSALKLQLPIFSAFLAHFQEQLSFAGGMKTEVEVVANGPPVDLYDSISRL